MVIKKFLRVIFAIIVGAVIGNLVAVVSTFGIDASYGESVTGGGWIVSLPNVIYDILIGLSVGFFSALIANWKGWLVGAIAQLLPGIIIIGAALFLNHCLPAQYVTSPWLWIFIGLLPAMIGGNLADSMVRDRELCHEMKSIKGHWLWLWIPLVGFAFYMSGSIRFIINALMIEWQIIFHPRFWIIGFIGLPFIIGMLYLAFSLPFTGAFALLHLHSVNKGMPKPSVLNRVGLSLLICFGIPAITMLIWFINAHILNFFEQGGFKIY